jgi:eukaryotic-like serine/threonine-protein kinase
VAATLYETYRARQNELLAERRFNDVRKLANSLFEIHDSVQDLPGATPARRLIVEDALRYLDSLSEEARGDQSLQRELASGYERIGNVQGSPFNANYGDAPIALRSFEKALRIREAIWSGNPRDIDDGLAFARSLRQLSDVSLVGGHTSTALDAGNKSVTVTQQLSALKPKDNNILVELFLDYESLANIYDGSELFSQDDVETALVFRQKEIETAHRLADLESSLRTKRILAVALTTAGDDLIYAGHRKKGLENYFLAKPILEGVVSQTGQQARPRYLLAEENARIALAQIAGGDVQGALASTATAISLGEELVRADPADELSRAVLGTYYAQLLEIDVLTGRLGHTREEIAKALSLMEGVQNHEEIVVKQSEVMLWNAAGDAEQRLGDNRKAEIDYEKAIAALMQLHFENGPTAPTREYLAASFNNLGRAQSAGGELQKSTESFRQALTLATSLTASKEPPLNALYAQADAYTGLGDVESTMARAYKGRERSMHYQRSCASYQQSLAIWNSIEEPGIVTPWGFLSVPPAVVSSSLAQCRGQLASF